MTVLAVFRERIPLVPVLTMEGVDQLKLLRRWIGLGAPDYVVTPTDQELLSASVRMGISTGRRQALSRAWTPEPPAQPSWCGIKGMTVFRTGL